MKVEIWKEDSSDLYMIRVIGELSRVIDTGYAKSLEEAERWAQEYLDHAKYGDDSYSIPQTVMDIHGGIHLKW